MLAIQTQDIDSTVYTCTVMANTSLGVACPEEHSSESVMEEEQETALDQEISTVDDAELEKRWTKNVFPLLKPGETSAHEC